jgi:hypothetical protein
MTRPARFDFRDLGMVGVGATIAGAAILLIDSVNAAVGYICGALATGLVAASAIRVLRRELDASREATASFRLELLHTWAAADQLATRLGEAPLPRPELSALISEEV